MAGRIRKAPGEPGQREVRQQRRRTRMACVMAEADTPSRQVGATSDHLRAVLSYLTHDQAQRLASDAVTYLGGLVEQAYRLEAAR